MDDSLHGYSTDSYGTDSDPDDVAPDKLSDWQRLKQRIDNKSSERNPVVVTNPNALTLTQHLQEQELDTPQVREQLSRPFPFSDRSLHPRGRTILLQIV